MNVPKRPAALLIVAQAICLLAVPLTLLGILLSVYPTCLYICQADFFQYDNTLIVALFGVARTLRDAILGGLLVWVEIEAFCVCGRVRKASAFSAENAKSLGRIALSLTLAGLMTLLFGDGLIPFLLNGLPPVAPIVERLLLPFMLLTFAGMLRAVQLLMRRALDMQDENNLTV